MKVLFVGTGLIGGSFSLAMQKHQLLTEAGGYSRKQINLDRSVELGLITAQFTDLYEGVRWADWIILSIPVDVIADMLPGLLDQLRPGQVVVDFGSTKGKICEVVSNHPNRGQFIAAHPIAGTEYSGPDAAFDSLFEDRLMIICEEERSEPEQMTLFKSICQKLSMRLEFMGAEAHDRHLAYISHLSHVTSYALSNAVLAKEKDGSVILDLAGSGFASTVRLAKSSPEMWAPIFMENGKMVLEAINEFLKYTEQLKVLIENQDMQGIQNFLEEGRKIRRVIK